MKSGRNIFSHSIYKHIFQAKGERARFSPSKKGNR